jgi:hypothetical protein
MPVEPPKAHARKVREEINTDFDSYVTVLKRAAGFDLPRTPEELPLDLLTVS